MVAATMRVCTCPQQFSQHDARSHLQCIVTRRTGLKLIPRKDPSSSLELSTRWRPPPLGCKGNSLQRLLDHISPFDFGRDREDLLTEYLDLRPAFFKTLQFRQWSQGQDWILHCYDAPRSGKTIFAAAIAQHLLALKAEDHIPKPDTAVVSIFADRCSDRGGTLAKLSGRLQVEAVLRTLLRQLIDQQHRPDRLRLATVAALSIPDKSSHRRVEVLKAAISNVARAFSRVYIIVDAVDHLAADNHVDLQNTLAALGSHFSILMLSSALNRSFTGWVRCDSPKCDLPDERLLLWYHCEDCSHYLCIACHGKGIKCYSPAHLLRAPDKVVHYRVSIDDKELREYIRQRLKSLALNTSRLSNDVAYGATRILSRILQCSSGSFGQAKLILDRMVNDSTVEDVTEMADRMPAVQIRHLNLMLFSVAQQDAADRQLAYEALTLVAAADRMDLVLSIGELVDALQFVVHGLSNVKHAIRSVTRQRVFAVAKGLLCLQGRDEVVVPFHSSLISYLWDECPQFALSHDDLADLCADVLHHQARQHAESSACDGRAMLDSCRQRPFVAWSQRHIIGLAMARKTAASMIDFLESSYHNNTHGLMALLATNRNYWAGSHMLHLCARHGMIEPTRLLLQRGHDKNVRDLITGATPTMIACQYGQVAVVQALFAAGADFSLQCKVGHTAFWKAVENNRLEVAQLLLDANDGSVLNMRCGNEGISAVMRAAQGGFDYDDMFSMLISSDKLDLTLTDTFGRTVLHRVLGPNETNDTALELLIDSPTFGDMVNVPEHNAVGRNAVMLVLQSTSSPNDKLDFLQMMVQGGADLAQLDNMDQSILHYAVKTGASTDILEYIISQGQVNVQQVDCFGKTVLDLARSLHCDATVLDLLQPPSKGGPDPVHPTREDSGIAGISPPSPTSKSLALIKQMGQSPAQFLADYGAHLDGFVDDDIRATDHQLNTLLHLAVRGSADDRLVHALLEDGRINVNAVNMDGQTALHLALIRLNDRYTAAEDGSTFAEPEMEMPFLLIQCLLQDDRTDMNIAEHDGRYPIDIAWQVAFVTGAGEENDSIDKPTDPMRPLFQLIEMGASIEHFSQQQVQITFEAAVLEAYAHSNPRPKAIGVLIAHGADVFRSMRNPHGQLPWQLIQSNRSKDHAEILKMLLREQERVLKSLESLPSITNVVL